MTRDFERHETESVGGETPGSLWEWEPDGYLDSIRVEIPLYDQLQDEVVRAVSGSLARTILELGVGSGETTRRVLAVQPNARLVGVDSSDAMLAAARASVPADRAEFLVQRLEDELPRGPFDVAVAVLVVHHLDASEKRRLFRRVFDVIAPGGRFVLGDLVVPREPAEATTPVDGLYDVPSGADEQVTWLAEAGFGASVAWEHRDLAVIVGVRPTARRDHSPHADC